MEEIRAKNKQLAEWNMSQQNVINEAHNNLAVVKSSEYSLAKQQFDSLYNRQQEILSQMGTSVIKSKLEDAVVEV